MFLISLQNYGNIYNIKDVISNLSFKNYIQVIKTLPILKYFINTLYIAIIGTFLTLLICSLASYPLARMQFKGKQIIFFLLISTLMLPSEANMIVNFITCKKLHLLNTFAGVYIPSIASVFGIFLLRQAFLVIPKEIEEAAIIDGANSFKRWLYIILPLSKPALTTLAIFTFVSYWNSFLWPLIILKNPDKYPLSVGLNYLNGTFSFDMRLIAAGNIIAMLPVIILFLLLQRYFTYSFTGANK